MITKGYCGNCKKRDKCKKLCNDVINYVNQDVVVQNEFLPPSSVGEFVTEPTSWGEESVRLFYPSHKKQYGRTKAFIIALHLDGKSNSEIAYHMGCTLRYIQYIVSEYKKMKDL